MAPLRPIFDRSIRWRFVIVTPGPLTPVWQKKCLSQNGKIGGWKCQSATGFYWVLSLWSVSLRVRIWWIPLFKPWRTGSCGGVSQRRCVVHMPKSKRVESIRQLPDLRWCTTLWTKKKQQIIDAMTAFWPIWYVYGPPFDEQPICCGFRQSFNYVSVWSHVALC